MSKVLIAIVSLLIGLACGGAGYYYWQRPAAHPHEPPKEVDTCCDPFETVTAEGEHDEHQAHEDAVELSAEAIREYGIATAEATGGQLESVLTLPGEIALNTDRVAHIVPRVGGLVRAVRKTLGDTVTAGEVLAVLESRELAEAKTADLSAEARLKLAEGQFKRIQGLQEQKLSSEQQYQEALHALEEARIVHRETIARLHALGLTHEQVSSLPDQDDADFSRYELKAPFAATVVDKHAALGELHGSGSELFVLADLSTVWVDVAVYPRDAARVQVGAKLRVLADVGAADCAPMAAEGTIHYVSPIMRESTRTGLARAEIANTSGCWRPGLFVTVEIVAGQEAARVLVPSDCIQTVDGGPVIFVAHEGKFEARPVTLGRSGLAQTEIKAGLEPGEQYITQGAVYLKAELSKGAGGHEH